MRASRNLLDTWYASEPEAQRVCTPEDAVACFLPLLTDDGGLLDVERFAVIVLDRARRVIEGKVLTQGNSEATVVCVRQIFRFALTRTVQVSAIIIGHNHPSGDPSPSTKDRAVTAKVVRAGRTLDIPVLDHIVIGSKSRFYSFAESGDLDAA